MAILNNPLITGLIGFVLGLLSWLVQQWYQRRKQKHQILILLHSENAQNLKKLDNFWRQVTDNLKDYPKHDLQKYHRLAYNPLSWDHLMWESQAPLLALLDEKLISGMYELNQNLDTFLLLRQKVRDVFDTPDNQRLWADYLEWMTDYYHKDIKRREKAQNTQEGHEMDIKVTQFSQSLVPLWNEINAQRNHIWNLGNPVPIKRRVSNRSNQS